ncbi:MAG: response regulator [Tannerella sp.]|jgi:signal transduction histidine kinase/ligand-binding sensor domain-containing protein/AraC-like DNA-binding protein|nr:response regulator [Tannerella sp.]
MLMKIHAFTLLILFASCFRQVSSQSTGVQFEHLSVDDGLSQLSVMAIFQDQKGFMWFGTRNGLNKYDGYSFEIFRESDADRHISNGYVECIAEDGRNRLWVGTHKGLNRYDDGTRHFVQYYHSSDNLSTISNDNILCLFRDHRGDLWVGSMHGLNRYIPETDNFERYSFDGLLSDASIFALAEDRDKNLWIGTERGLYVYDPSCSSIVRHPQNAVSDRISALFCDSKGRMWTGFYQNGVYMHDVENDRFLRFGRDDGLNHLNIRCIEQDMEGNIIVGSFGGLNRYDEQKCRFISVEGDRSGAMTMMNNFSVYSVFCDRAGTLWAGTYSGGVSYYSPYNQCFRFHDPGDAGHTLFGIVGPIVEHESGIWIGTEGGGLLFFDRKHRSYHYYLLPGATERSFSTNIVKSLFLENDKLWTGATNGNVYLFDVSSRKFVRSVSPPWGSVHYVVFKDLCGSLWIGASGSNSLGYMTLGDEFVHPLPLQGGQTFRPSNVRCILEDSPGVFYIATSSGGIHLYDTHSGTVRSLQHADPYNNSPAAYKRITSLCKTRNGDIWASTFGGGISRLDRTSGSFENFGRQHGLANETVYSLLEDRDGKLWLSTDDGISCFDPVTKTFANFDKNNGIFIAEFTPGSGIVTADNEVFFGGNNGFVSFRPYQIRENSYIPPVLITKISVNNRETDGTPTLNLTHKQSNMTVEFSALNFIYPQQNQYAYKLEGFDREWNYVGKRRVAYYTNIPPGDYTFLVKGSNNDGVWNSHPTAIHVRISQPPWNTWWAWTLYLTAFTTGLLLIVRYARIKNRLETNIRIEQMEKEKMEELHRTKINLFTNFSHELRTPLTLILNPLEEILQNNHLSPSLHETLKLIYKNAGRLLYTVNQLMDFRKKESGHLRLRAAEGNIVKFTNEIFTAFNCLARNRNIYLRLECSMEELHLWYDRDLLEKVLFNLLSNAFKNTPDGGRITLSLSLWKLSELKAAFDNRKDIFASSVIHDFAMITVSDTGQGIPEQELEKIFDPFYQVRHPKAQISQPFGTGIGLNLCKGVVELHHGVIWADNTTDMHTAGAVFRVALPLGKTHLKECDVDTSFRNSEDPSHYMIPEGSDTYQDIHPKQDLTCSVLIVEDNMDVRHYIKSHLQKLYSVYEANNGQEAFDMATEYLPDLIVSDIMMPVMDGILLCRMLKNDLRTGHIPVILLTARATVMHVQEGFDTGADDYVTKPFNAGLLVTRIRNLIASRERLKELFGKKTSPTFPDLPTSQVDSRFMDAIYKFINEHLTDPDLNMDVFCRETGMSRSAFYRKIKILSDLNPSELIRNTRLRFSTKYITETDMTISEIAYEVGFSSPSYFTKSFKEHFHMSPTEMRNKFTREGDRASDLKYGHSEKET